MSNDQYCPNLTMTFCIFLNDNYFHIPMVRCGPCICSLTNWWLYVRYGLTPAAAPCQSLVNCCQTLTANAWMLCYGMFAGEHCQMVAAAWHTVKHSLLLHASCQIQSGIDWSCKTVGWYDLLLKFRYAQNSQRFIFHEACRGEFGRIKILSQLQPVAKLLSIRASLVWLENTLK